MHARGIGVTDTSRATQQSEQHAGVLTETLLKDFKDLRRWETTFHTKLDIDAEKRVFQIASEVAINQAVALTYSDYHIWSALCGKTKKAVRQLATRFWNEIHPFGDCLTRASHVTIALKAVLHADEQVARYADNVQLIADRIPNSKQIVRKVACTLRRLYGSGTTALSSIYQQIGEHSRYLLVHFITRDSQYPLSRIS